jgi:hypothetical protein
MSIQEKIKAVQDKINEQRLASGGVSSAKAVEVQEAAAAAILLGGEKIRDYMRIFTQDEEELAKMMPDPAKPPHKGKNLARAYLMGDGNCGPASPQGPGLGLLFGVSGILDDDEEQ